MLFWPNEAESDVEMGGKGGGELVSTKEEEDD